MSNQNNDELFDRAGALMPYLNAQEALDLNACVEDLESFYSLVNKLEQRYLNDDGTPLTEAQKALQAKEWNDDIDLQEALGK